MHNSYRYRWMITVLACAGLIGLALAGGTWQTSSASVNPPTIPGISTMDPGWLRLWTPNATLTITGGPFITGYPGGPWTVVRFTRTGQTIPLVEVVPDQISPTSLRVLLGSDIMGQPGTFDVVVVNHPGTAPEIEVSDHLHLTISDGSLYLPLITHNH